MNIINRLIYKLKLFLKIEKPIPLKPFEGNYSYKIVAINKKDKVEAEPKSVTLRFTNGKTLSCFMVKGATAYRVNGQRTEIVAVK